MKSKIEWTDETWPVVTGCSFISEGCENCYAARMAATRLKHHPRYKGLAEMVHGKPRWIGSARFNEDILRDPALRWRKPRMIFVASMGDLFHIDIHIAEIAAVWKVMDNADWHIFQVLTKRPERFNQLFEYVAKWVNIKRPLANAWLGVTVENQKAADKRIPLLLDAPAAVHFVSCEPLLGPIDLERWLYPRHEIGRAEKLDWVIVGGESGPNARPMHPDWARTIRDDCHAAKTPFFFKQWGEWSPTVWAEGSLWVDIRGNTNRRYSAMMEGPIKLYRVGKKAAGRLLDGREWNEMPESFVGEE